MSLCRPWRQLKQGMIQIISRNTFSIPRPFIKQNRSKLNNQQNRRTLVGKIIVRKRLPLHRTTQLWQCMYCCQSKQKSFCQYISFLHRFLILKYVCSLFANDPIAQLSQQNIFLYLLFCYVLWMVQDKYFMKFYRYKYFRYFCMDWHSMNTKQKERCDFIAKCQSVAKAKGIDFSTLPSTLHLEDIFQKHQEKLMKFGEDSAMKYLQQALTIKPGAVSNKDSTTINNKYVESKGKDILKVKTHKLLESSKMDVQELFIEKDKYIDYQLQLLDQWKNYRRSSSTQWEAIDSKFKQILWNCIPLQFIIRQGITSLKVIHVVNHSNKYALNQEWFCYSISAFRLFKLIHRNKQLKEATIKGIQIEMFQQFVRKLKAVKVQNKGKLQNKVSNWMKDFNPSKSLILCINASMKFYISSHKSAFRINELQFFVELFSEVSDITVKICLGKCKNIDVWMHNMHMLVSALKKTKDIMLIVLKKKEYIGNRYTTDQLASVLRCGLFGGLACLTNIAHLQLNDIPFPISYSVPKESLAVEQIMRDILEKNAIKHLKLNICSNFPMLPKLTHKLVNLNSSFRKDNTLRSLVLQNPELKSINFLQVRQSLTIDEKLFNQLQFLSIYRCDNISVSQLRPQSPSNIKYLKLGYSPMVTHFPLMVSKLCQLTYLSINNINFGDFLLCRIPSPYLEQLTIQNNNQITERGIEEIDKKWPKLRHLQFWRCPRLTGVTWENCKFEGLINLLIDYKAFLDKEKHTKLLAKKGVKFTINWFQ